MPCSRCAKCNNRCLSFSLSFLCAVQATTVGSLVAIANFFFLLMLMLYIFALVGMQMFGGKVDISNGPVQHY